jgi:hypothetical protein
VNYLILVVEYMYWGNCEADAMLKNRMVMCWKGECERCVVKEWEGGSR